MCDGYGQWQPVLLLERRLRFELLKNLSTDLGDGEKCENAYCPKTDGNTPPTSPILRNEGDGTQGCVFSGEQGLDLSGGNVFGGCAGKGSFFLQSARRQLPVQSVPLDFLRLGQNAASFGPL